MTSRVPGNRSGSRGGLTSLGYVCGYLPPDVVGVLEVLACFIIIFFSMFESTVYLICVVVLGVLHD